MLHHIVDSVERAGPAPEGLTENSALREILASEDLYSQEPKNLAEYDPSRLALLDRDISAQDVRPFLSAEASARLHHFTTCIEYGCAEATHRMEHDDVPKPYWDPKLRDSQQLRLQLYLSLLRKGQIGSVTRPKSFVGLFFVKKKNMIHR